MAHNTIPIGIIAAFQGRRAHVVASRPSAAEYLVQVFTTDGRVELSRKTHAERQPALDCFDALRWKYADARERKELRQARQAHAESRKKAKRARRAVQLEARDGPASHVLLDEYGAF